MIDSKPFSLVSFVPHKTGCSQPRPIPSESLPACSILYLSENNANLYRHERGGMAIICLAGEEL